MRLRAAAVAGACPHERRLPQRRAGAPVTVPITRNDARIALDCLCAHPQIGTTDPDQGGRVADARACLAGSAGVVAGHLGRHVAGAAAGGLAGRAPTRTCSRIDTRRDDDEVMRHNLGAGAPAAPGGSSCVRGRESRGRAPGLHPPHPLQAATPHARKHNRVETPPQPPPATLRSDEHHAPDVDHTAHTSDGRGGGAADGVAPRAVVGRSSQRGHGEFGHPSSALARTTLPTNLPGTLLAAPSPPAEPASKQRRVDPKERQRSPGQQAATGVRAGGDPAARGRPRATGPGATARGGMHSPLARITGRTPPGEQAPPRRRWRRPHSHSRPPPGDPALPPAQAQLTQRQRRPGSRPGSAAARKDAPAGPRLWNCHSAPRSKRNQIHDKCQACTRPRATKSCRGRKAGALGCRASA
jgi:hypothetical protein